jgi:hypothetical protein
MTLSKNATNRRAKSIPLIQSGISEFAEYVNKKTFLAKPPRVAKKNSQRRPDL